MALAPDISPLAENAAPNSRFHTNWRIITFLLVLLGFIGLAFTGEIHPVGITIFLVGWCLGLAWGRVPLWWPAWLSHVLVWITLILIGFIALHGEFVSLLYLLMFLGLFKCL